MTDETQKRIPPEVFARRRRTRAPGQTIEEPAEDSTQVVAQAKPEKLPPWVPVHPTVPDWNEVDW